MRMTRGPAGRQGRPFPTFAMSHCNRDGCAVFCLARSEVQAIHILFVACRICFVVLVRKQLRCASDLIISVSERLGLLLIEYKIQQIRNTYFCFFRSSNEKLDL